MSIKLMGQVWELKLDHATSYVLIAMADHASDDGSRCFPSVGYLSWKTNYSVRSVQRILVSLENTGIIIPVAYQNGGRGFATEYQLVLAAAPRNESYQVAGTKLSGKLRTATIARFNHVCQYCNKSGDAEKGPDGIPWEIDRITPGKQGGLYVPANVTLSCRLCNRKKGATLSPNVSDASTPTDQELIHLSQKGANDDQELIHLSQKGANDNGEVAQMTPQPLVNHQEPSVNHQEPSATTRIKRPEYPEWFQPLTELKGFKATAHKQAIQCIPEGCEEAGVNEADVVKHFAEYYTDGGRATNGWSDPVAALTHTLPLQIKKTRDRLQVKTRPSVSPTASVNSTDFSALEAELEARRQKEKPEANQ